jgi:diguanylate cyclase (GGDEF)-like protein/PAS domain S-box-containing protein
MVVDSAGKALQFAEREEAAGIATSLARLSFLSAEQVSNALNSNDATALSLDMQLALLRMAIENISQGLCVFSSDKRLLLWNRRYAEMYRLRPEQITQGLELKEIVELRLAAGTCPMGKENYMLVNEIANASDSRLIRMVELQDGRTIQISHLPLADKGWVATHDDITESLAIRAIGGQHISMQTLIDWVPDYLWVKDTESRFVVANKALAADHGITRTTDVIGLSDFDLHPVDVARSFRAREMEILNSGNAQFDEVEESTDAHGDEKWVLSTKVPLRNERDEIYGLLGIGRDITERKRAEILRDGQARILEMIAVGAQLDDVLAQVTQLIERQLVGASCAIMLMDADGSRLTHCVAPSLPESFLRVVEDVPVGPDSLSCGTAAFLRDTVVAADIATDSRWAACRSETLAHGLRSCWSKPILSHQNTVLGTLALYAEIAHAPNEAELNLLTVGSRLAGIAIARKHAEDRIHFMAHHDPLTGLPNRTLLKDRLTQALFKAKVSGLWVSVVFIDFDNFKVINDSLGHTAGDVLLRIAAMRMSDCVGPTNTVVRLGGDEFVILLMEQPAGTDAIVEQAHAIRKALAEPIELKGHDLRITCSMGISSYPRDGADADALIANADAAMYRAKENGRDNCQLYTPDLNARAQERFLLLEALKIALERSQFVLYYQPQVKLEGQLIFAAEALVRWNHPSLGLVSPIKFIPIAEETGLIVPIGDWVLREACRQNKAWHDAGLPKITVCVNVSARQFLEKDLVSRVIAALSASGLEAGYLELELTESLIMRDVPQAIRTMEQLQALGVTLAIDDFGTGYSSLSALKSFPVARLKIDKSFIADLSTNENDRAVTSAVISLGQKLKMKIIAEGVETEAQLAFLKENNCDEMQGYHFCKPVPAAEFERLLMKQ